MNINTGNDAWDGSNATHTNGTNIGPKQHISSGLGATANSGTLYIAAGTYKENKITVTKNLTIIGEGKTNTTIDATSTNVVFWIKSGSIVTIKNLNITNGLASKTDFSRNGGGIYNEGTLILDNCIFYNDRAQDASNAGGAAGHDASAAGNGGAIYNTGTLTVTNCQFSSNHAGQGGDASATHKSSAGGNGGAIYNAGLVLNIQACTFTNNYAGRGGASSAFHDGNKGGSGGAIYNAGTINNILNCTFTTNHAGNGGSTQSSAAANPGTGGNGGAISNTHTMTITSCTFDGNYAGNGGNGTDLNNGATGGYGGAIYNDGLLTIIGSEMRNNSAGKGGTAKGAFNPGDYGKGGAIYNGANGNLTLTNDTFTDNTGCYGAALADESKNKTTLTNCNFNSNAAQAFDENGNPVSYNTFNMTTGQIVKTILYGIAGVVNTFTFVYTPSGVSKIIETVHNILAAITEQTIQATGGAIYMSGTSNLNLTGCNFYNNTAAIGGAIHNFGTGTLTVTGSSFEENSAGLGGGIYSDNVGPLIVKNCLFDSNMGGDNGAIFFGGTSDSWVDCNITENIFKNNTAVFGTVFYNGINGISHSHLNFNQIYGTNSYDVFNEYDLNKIDATYNWWGSNYGPDTYSTSSGCNIDTSHYMVLTITSPTDMIYDENKPITIDILHDNYGVPQNPELKIIPDGIHVNLTTTNGKISPESVTLIGGNATATYFAIGSIGSAEIHAFADNDQAHPTIATINIQKIPTTTHNVHITYYGTVGSNITLNATVYDYHNAPVNEGTLTFSVGDLDLTASVLNGSAAYLWTIPSSFQPNYNYNIYTTYNGDSIYADSIDPFESELVVQSLPAAHLTVTKTVQSIVYVGGNFMVTIKVGNNGPGVAKDVVFNIPIPDALQFIDASVDQGTCSFNPSTRTLTWNIGDVEVGDPHLYLTLKPTKLGEYLLNYLLTTLSYDPNPDNHNTPLIIQVEVPPDHNENGPNENPVNGTIPMQKTGTPVAGLILAILTVLGGFASSKRGRK